MARVLAALAALLVLGGCATAAQRQGEALQSAIQAIEQEASACYEAAAIETHVYERLPKVANLDAPSLGSLNDGTHITDAEHQALSDWLEATGPCRVQIMRGYDAHAPMFSPAYAKLFSDTDRIAAALARGETTWGQTNQARVDSWTRFKQARYEIAARLANDLNAAHFTEAAQRQAAFQNMQQIMYQQQILDQINQPTQVNCHQFGNTVNCTSW